MRKERDGRVEERDTSVEQRPRIHLCPRQRMPVTNKKGEENIASNTQHTVTKRAQQSLYQLLVALLSSPSRKRAGGANSCKKERKRRGRVCNSGRGNMCACTKPRTRNEVPNRTLRRPPRNTPIQDKQKIIWRPNLSPRPSFPDQVEPPGQTRIYARRQPHTRVASESEGERPTQTTAPNIQEFSKTRTPPNRCTSIHRPYAHAPRTQIGHKGQRRAPAKRRTPHRRQT